MSPPDLHTDPEALTSVEERQVDDTTGGQHGDNIKIKSPAENDGDPSSVLWSMCLNKSKDMDDQIAGNWAKNMGEVFVFTGLFSAIVAAFIMESYKKLSPDSGDQTVALLTQLVNISTGAPVVVQTSPSFKPPASIVRVNVMWILSLILSLSCALLAALMLQSARLYQFFAQHYYGVPRRRARMRAYMLNGLTGFWMPQAVQATHLLLHTSIFLFFAGLVDFLLPINKVVAFSALGCVVVFVSIYATLTLLPVLRHNFLYHTPLTSFTYSLLQFSALSLFFTAQGTERVFRGLLLKIPRLSRVASNSWPNKWRAILEEKVGAHRKRLLGGLYQRIELSALKAPPSVYTTALNWTLFALDEKEFEDFVARMPGFFDYRAGPDTTLVMLSLMSDQPTSDPILGSRLRELFDTCTPGTPLLSEEQRTNRLRVCLKSLWYCVRAYNLPENSGVPLAPYVCDVFASPEVIRWIQTEQDLAIRLLGRCFGSLIVKKLANDFTQPNRSGTTDITAEQTCLPYILGATDEQVRGWLGQNGAIDLANVISLASGELETLVASGTKEVPTDVVDVFQQTLSILAEGIVSSHASIRGDTGRLPPDQVRFRVQFQEINSKFADAQIPDVVKERLRQISEILRLNSVEEEGPMEIPSPEQEPETPPYPGTSQRLRAARRGGRERPYMASVMARHMMARPVSGRP